MPILIVELMSKALAMHRTESAETGSSDSAGDADKWWLRLHVLR